MIIDDITIKIANITDAEEIAQLFSDTIQTVNSKDYTQDQIDAWSSSSQHLEKWQHKITEQYFIVAIYNQLILGFSSLEKSGYLDFMYIHKDYQRRGIANKLLTEIETKATNQKNNIIFSDVSITALPFFEAHQYIVKREKIRESNNQKFISFEMYKPL